MAAPNIVNVTTITGKVAGLLPTTSAANIVSNAAASGTLVKVNSLVVANVNGTTAADITVQLYKNQSVLFPIAWTVSVPADSSIVIVSKDSGIYLEENDSIQLTASINSYLSAVCSYEIIS